MNFILAAVAVAMTALSGITAPASSRSNQIEATLFALGCRQ
jgi:hypothetical protein